MGSDTATLFCLLTHCEAERMKTLRPSPIEVFDLLFHPEDPLAPDAIWKTLSIDQIQVIITQAYISFWKAMRCEFDLKIAEYNDVFGAYVLEYRNYELVCERHEVVQSRRFRWWPDRLRRGVMPTPPTPPMRPIAPMCTTYSDAYDSVLNDALALVDELENATKSASYKVRKEVRAFRQKMWIVSELVRPTRMGPSASPHIIWSPPR